MKCILCPNEMVFKKEKEYQYYCLTDPKKKYFSHYFLNSEQCYMIIDKYEINIANDSNDVFVWIDGNFNPIKLPKNKIDWDSGKDNIKECLDKLLILL